MRTALACFLLLTQCEVSAFGSNPVVIGGSSGGTSQGGHACAEPDDARRAREGGPEACASHCRIDVASGETNCDEVSLGDVRPGLATLDMSSDDGVLLTFEICDPSGYVMQISDSPTARPEGGDQGSTSHDADLALEGTTLALRAATGSGVSPSSVAGFVSATGCSTRTIVLADQIAYLVETTAGMCGTGMLRISPPTDAHGAPDARWYLGLTGSVDGTVTGSGVRSVDLCFW
jgi:hypothetical protein